MILYYINTSRIVIPVHMPICPCWFFRTHRCQRLWKRTCIHRISRDEMSPATVTKASPQMARISNLKNRVQELRQTRSSQLPLDFKCCSTKLQMKLCLCEQAAASAICLVPLVIYWGCSKQQQWSRGGCWNIRGMTIWHPSCSHPCCCCGRRAWQAKEPLEAWADDVVPTYWREALNTCPIEL